MFIQPTAGDAGGALGAALAVYYIYFGNELKHKSAGDDDYMKGAFLGPEYSDAAIEGVARKYKAVFNRHKHFETLADETALLISRGNVIGWFQGRMEFVPRALGNRSILGDARMPEMQKKLNLKIKLREGFRPFAPSVLAEHISKYFEMNTPSPYMLIVADVKPEIRKVLPEAYEQMNLYEKLYIQRSEIPAVTHVDFSARIQSVHNITNERYYRLIEAYRKLSGFAVIVNTSFNVRGEPIVCSPDDAYQCFMNTEMDYLVMGNYLFDKKMQPEFKMKGVKKYGND